MFSPNTISIVFCVFLSIFSACEARRNCTQLNTENPCKCEPGKFGRRLICPKISSELNLNLVVQCTNRFHVSEFVIDNSELRYINQDTFQGTAYKRIHIKDTTLLSLTDKREAFKGLENELRELIVESASYVGKWDWSSLKNLKVLHSITVIKSDYDFATVFDGLPNLERLVLSFNDMTGIESKAFATLSGLKELILSNNRISFIERSMFPKNATKLENLDLSFNALRTFPNGVFEDLPALKMLYLNGNAIHSIEERVFKPIWNQLKFINFAENPLICDCRLKWVANTGLQPGQISARCSSPEDLKGSSLSSLKATDLWC